MRKIMFAGCIALLVAAHAHAQGDKGAVRVKRFDYQGVVLQDGPLKRQFDEVRDFYLRLPNDDILRGYRLRAGLPAPGAELTGCYIGHNAFGQVLSGLARMYAATQDARCKEKAEALMRGWAECIAPDGFFFIEKEPGLPPYYYDKNICGLIDLYLYCGTKEALPLLGRITDWAIANLDRARLYARPTGPGGGEWYTLSENLYRAWRATGDTKYRDFAEVWEYTEYWDLFKNKQDIFAHPMNGGWYHAYSHLNTFSSCGAAYLVKGKPGYLDTLKNAYDFFQDTQCYATGGFGPNECLMPRDKLAAMLRDTSNHFETQCGSWAIFKLCKYLIEFTGDARYGDWIEQMVLNGIGASIPMDPDGGVFYYSEYNLGGSAKQNMAPWACCSGTRPQAVADFHDIIYFYDDNALYVNLFTPSSVTWTCGGVGATVTQSTRFPEKAVTQLTIHTERPVEFAIKVRVPGWLNRPMKAWDIPVSIKGWDNTISVNANVDAHGWAVFSREWKSGDVLMLEFPMQMRVAPFLKDKPYPTAITYGPVAMVARCAKGNPSAKFDFADLAGSLQPVDGDPLNFRLKADNDILVRPFYQMKRGERYFMYFEPENPYVRVPRTKAVLSPNWIDFGGWHATCTVGSNLRYTFTGNTLRILGQLYDDAGQYDVQVDEKKVGIIDQYGPNRGEPRHWDYVNLGDGRHELVMTLLPDKNPQSKGNYVNITGFECAE